MKLSIIADDLTGANDSGVQLARQGLRTSVLLDADRETLTKTEAVVLDTDTRSLPVAEAYERVAQASRLLREAGFDTVYKKIDSTLRGNLGAEIDAVFDVFQPDVAIIAPAYPQNGRTVVQGVHYLHGVRLDETEFALSPKDPVTEAYIPDLLREQTERGVALISTEQLRQGAERLSQQLKDCVAQHMPYLVFDAQTEEDLQCIARYVHQTPYTVLWVGSAGLAQYLADVYGWRKDKRPVSIAANEKPVLCVVGSVSRVSRKQLEALQKEPNVYGLRLDAMQTLSSSGQRMTEMGRVIQEGREALQRGRHLALYSSGSEQDIAQVQQWAQQRGLSSSEAADEIVRALGEAAAQLIEENDLQGIIMTGGDTAKQVCLHLGIKGFELLDEIETGIPFGRLIGKSDIYAVTKAGAFGSEQTFVNAIHLLQGKGGIRS